MSRLALGTAQFGSPYGISNRDGKVSFAVAKSMLKFASENGIDFIDTAISYGDSERCLGAAGIEGFNIITKLPRVPENCSDIELWVNRQIKSSLSKLKTENIYALLLHAPQQLLSSNGPKLFQALQRQKNNGYVKKIGISIYSPTELELIIQKYSLDLVQAPFNLVDQSFYQSGWMKKLKDAGLEIHVRSVFLQGLLLLKKSDIPSKFLKWNHLWMIWHEWLLKNKVSPIHACLDFALSFSEIDRVIIGADNKSQLLELASHEKKQLNLIFPDFCSNDLDLINPSNWDYL